jgi:hypothetical protein
MSDFTEIVSSVNHLRHDIRAEVIAAEIIENGLNPSEFLIVPDGSFRRKFSRDISKAEILTLGNGQKVVGMHLTRDGLYDTLPEALFHEPLHEPYDSGNDMAKLSKKQKIEEKEARRFFLPFENELFFQRIQIEEKERDILARFSETLFYDIYPQFWKFDRTLPKKLVSRLVQILHWSHKVIGKNDLTAQCLEAIIDEKVTISSRRRGLPHNHFSGTMKEKTPGLGSAHLGENFICGEYQSDSDPVLEIVIGPLRNSTPSDYLENGSYTRFLESFFGFFIPVELDPLVTIKVCDEEYGFTLNEAHPEVILGYNSGI